jgi:hypothetical protein
MRSAVFLRKVEGGHKKINFECRCHDRMFMFGTCPEYYSHVVDDGLVYVSSRLSKIICQSHSHLAGYEVC